tara:strand:- start:29 stop:505 length:477 start_codon:yes stop_codon:yes gene_type:complete
MNETNEKKITFNIKKRENTSTSSLNNDEKSQLKYVNMLFCDESFINDKKIKSEISQKINSYKNQDLKKKRTQGLITYNELIEKLVISKLKCYYCKSNVAIIYENVRQSNQWTLERIDNTISHTNDNCVICCLECNLKRRCINSDRFKYSKEFINIKKV